MSIQDQTSIGTIVIKDKAVIERTLDNIKKSLTLSQIKRYQHIVIKDPNGLRKSTYRDQIIIEATIFI